MHEPHRAADFKPGASALKGREAGSRIYKKSNDWSTPFAIEITSVIDWNRPEQNIIIRVEDKSGQGGIWKPVWLVSRSGSR